MRALIAWSPIFAAIGVGLAATFLKSVTVFEAILVGGLVVLAVGAVHALVTPARGIQDRLAGTWLVPR